MSILEISFCNSSNGYPTKKLDLSCELPPWSRVLFRHKIPHILGNQNVLYHVHKNLSLVYILKHMSPTHLLTPCFLNNHFNIILPSIPGSVKWSLLFRFTDRNVVCIYYISHAFYMHNSCHN